MRFDEREEASVGRLEGSEAGAERGGCGRTRGAVVGWKWERKWGMREVRADSRESGVEEESMLDDGGGGTLDILVIWVADMRGEGNGEVKYV